MSRTAKRKSRDGRVLPDGVSERADGRFIYRYQLYGKPHYIYDRDLNGLKAKISQLQVDMTLGKNMDISKLSLDEWYPQYLETFKKNKVKDCSYLNMQQYYHWYIEDTTVGVTPICNLKRAQLVAHFQKLADDKGLAHGTLRSLASMLYNSLQQVVYEKGTLVNPATEIMKDVKARPVDTREALSEKQVAVLFEFLQQEGYQKVYLPIIGILIGTGLRYGECVGLTWSDIDFERGILHINKTLNYRQRVKGGPHEYFCTQGKTKNATRDIYINKELLGLMEIQRKYHRDMRIRNDFKTDIYNDKGEIVGTAKGFIFTSKLGKPFTHEGFQRILRNMIKKINVWQAKEVDEPIQIDEDITPHYFRHTFCTRVVEDMMKSENKDYERLKILMGHSSIKTSIDIYTTISEDLAKKNWSKAPTLFTLQKTKADTKEGKKRCK
ncbi:MAG: tyrosine-type recombinase/integrase [Lachnospiraceae bacterium]|nr:tyrosine-type recombinase/integrase [Lachnospiraceae bacterium]